MPKMILCNPLIKTISLNCSPVWIMIPWCKSVMLLVKFNLLEINLTDVAIIKKKANQLLLYIKAVAICCVSV